MTEDKVSSCALVVPHRFCLLMMTRYSFIAFIALTGAQVVRGLEKSSYYEGASREKSLSIVVLIPNLSQLSNPSTNLLT